ncbi:MAG: ABC transporter permease, partial [Promethearchaeota archaeon]
ILDRFFDFSTRIGPWTPQNYMIFVFVGYNIMIMQSMIDYIPKSLIQEKYWKTLPALMMAPFNRFYLLFGYIISEFVGILIPFTAFFVVILIFFPLSVLSIVIIILMFLGIGIVFSGLGLFLGVFAISNENFLYLFNVITRFLFWFSCVSYPFQLFPRSIQNIINLNPIYYLIDLIRLTWIENNFTFTILSHPIHFSIFTFSLVIFPLVCVYVFNIIYKKLGITGY